MTTITLSFSTDESAPLDLMAFLRTALDLPELPDCEFAVTGSGTVSLVVQPAPEDTDDDD